MWDETTTRMFHKFTLLLEYTLEFCLDSVGSGFLMIAGQLSEISPRTSSFSRALHRFAYFTVIPSLTSLLQLPTVGSMLHLRNQATDDLVYMTLV